jgi:A/G-specific adenine glycosylase
VLVRRGGRVLLLRWPEGRRWAGLWDFPRFPIHSETPAAVHHELVEKVRTLVGVTIAPGRHFKTLTHGVTRFHITLQCYEAAYISRATNAAIELETRWLRPSELINYPLSSTGRKLANHLWRVASQPKM